MDLISISIYFINVHIDTLVSLFLKPAPVFHKQVTEFHADCRFLKLKKAKIVKLPTILICTNNVNGNEKPPKRNIQLNNIKRVKAMKISIILFIKLNPCPASVLPKWKPVN